MFPDSSWSAVYLLPLGQPWFESVVSNTSGDSRVLRVLCFPSSQAASPPEFDGAPLHATLRRALPVLEETGLVIDATTELSAYREHIGICSDQTGGF